MSRRVTIKDWVPTRPPSPYSDAQELITTSAPPPQHHRPLPDFSMLSLQDDAGFTFAPVTSPRANRPPAGFDFGDIDDAHDSAVTSPRPHAGFTFAPVTNPRTSPRPRAELTFAPVTSPRHRAGFGSISPSQSPRAHQPSGEPIQRSNTISPELDWDALDNLEDLDRELASEDRERIQSRERGIKRDREESKLPFESRSRIRTTPSEEFNLQQDSALSFAPGRRIRRPQRSRDDSQLPSRNRPQFPPPGYSVKDIALKICEDELKRCRQQSRELNQRMIRISERISNMP